MKNKVQISSIVKVVQNDVANSKRLVYMNLQVTTDEHGQLIVARVMAGSAAAKQALLAVGDVLLEVDGVQIDSEEQLKEAVSKPNERITLKVGPNLKEKSSQMTNKLSVSNVLNLNLHVLHESMCVCLYAMFYLVFLPAIFTITIF